MKFTCELKKLSEVVNGVSLAVAAKTTLPVLEGILLRCRGNDLTLCAYNMELGIRYTLPVAGEENGELVVDARKFSDFLRKAAGEILTFQSDEKLVTHLKCGSTQMAIDSMSPEEFPLLPEIESVERFKLPQGTLKNMIGQTLYAVAVSEAMPVLTGSLFDIGDGMLKMVSVDGYQLAMRKEPVETAETFQFLVPGKTLSEVSKLLKDDNDEEIEVIVGKNHVQFMISGYVVISRLLEGKFLDYKAAISGETVTRVKVSKRLFSQSIDRASIVINERVKSHIRCDFRAEEISLFCATSIGKISDVIPAEVIGPNLTIGFSNRYMYNALRAADTDEVILEMKDAVSPIRVLPPEGDSFLFLVLPWRIKE